MPDLHTVHLDKQRKLQFSHAALRDLDEELKARHGITLFEWLSQFPAAADEMSEEEATRIFLRNFDFDVVLTGYRYALQKHYGDLDDQDVSEILDKASLEPQDLLGNLMVAHPYLNTEETPEGAAGTVESQTETVGEGEPDVAPLRTSGSGTS